MTAILKVKDGNGNVIPIQAIKGEKGEKGDRGLPGSGGVPDGGTTGQVLTKNSDADGDAGWKEPYTYVLPAATSQTLGGVKIGNGINIAEDGTISSEGSGSASAVLYTEQTLTDEQKTQALTNIGGLSKNQGTANSGKFLGIGADGIVVPTDVGGGSEWRKIKDLSVTSEAGVTFISITEDQDGNSFSLDEVFILIKSETKQFAYAQITIPNGSQSATVGEYRLAANETENAPGVIRIRPFGPFWIATFMNGGYHENVVDKNWGFYYQKSQALLSAIPKITGIGIGFSTINAEVWGR